MRSKREVALYLLGQAAMGLFENLSDTSYRELQRQLAAAAYVAPDPGIEAVPPIYTRVM